MNTLVVVPGLVFGTIFFAVLSAWSLLRQMMLTRDAWGSRVDYRAAEQNPVYYFVSQERLASIAMQMALTAGVGALAASFALGAADPGVCLLTGLVAGLAGYGAPHAWFRWQASRRRRRFGDQMLPFVDGMRDILRAGSDQTDAVRTVAGRLEDPMRQELEYVLSENDNMGIPLPEGLERLHRRMPDPDLRLLTTAIEMRSQTGGSLVEILDMIAEAVRSRMEHRDKLHALTAGGRCQAYGVALAPFVVVIILSLVDPSLMTSLFTTTIGWCAVSSACLLEMVGFVVIWRIVHVEA